MSKYIAHTHTHTKDPPCKTIPKTRCRKERQLSQWPRVPVRPVQGSVLFPHAFWSSFFFVFKKNKFYTPKNSVRRPFSSDRGTTSRTTHPTHPNPAPPPKKKLYNAEATSAGMQNRRPSRDKQKKHPFPFPSFCFLPFAPKNLTKTKPPPVGTTLFRGL